MSVIMKAVNRIMIDRFIMCISNSEIFAMNVIYAWSVIKLQ